MTDEIAGVIRNAKSLRDYVLLSGSVSASDLIKSLTPFDIDPALRNEEKLAQLQVDVANVARSIDPDTRHRVLSGQFRKPAKPSGADGTPIGGPEYGGLNMNVSDYVSAVSLVIFGFIALWLLSSYSMLAVRTSQWLNEVEHRGARDYVSEMKNIFDVVVSQDARQVAADPIAIAPSSQVQPSELATYRFMAGVERLNAMVAGDETLMRDANEIEQKYYWCDLGGGAWPYVQRITNTLFSARCVKPTPSAAPRDPARNPIDVAISQTTSPTEAAALLAFFKDALANVNSARSEVEEAVAQSRESATFAAQQVAIARGSLVTTNKILYSMGAYPGGISPKEAVLADGVKAFAIETTNQWLTGMSALNGKFDPRNFNTVLETAKTKLVRYLEIMNGWILPVLFGALGAIVLCLTRTASKFYATPSFTGILARLALAMLGGALISIILAPTYFATLVTTSSSFVFLLCFVFGYSTSAFVTLLDTIANKLAGTKV